MLQRWLLVLWTTISIAIIGQAMTFRHVNRSTSMSVADAVVDSCVQAQDGNPPPLTWDRPMWKYIDDGTCKAHKRLDENGRCSHNIVPLSESKCGAFCHTARGWFYGRPFDLMRGEICAQGDSCSRSVSITAQDGEKVEQSWSDSDKKEQKQSEAKTFSEKETTGMKESLDLEISPTAIGTTTGNALADGAIKVWDFIMKILKIKFNWNEYSDSTTAYEWKDEDSTALTKGEDYTWKKTITDGISIQTSRTLSRSGAAEMTYCGSWYAIPKIYFNCGVFAAGRLDKEDGNRQCYSNTNSWAPMCNIWAQYHGRGPTKNRPSTNDLPGKMTTEHYYEGTVHHDQVFVRKDCETREILPAAWQDEPFRNAMGFGDYMREHISRYSDWYRPTFHAAQRIKNSKDQVQAWGTAPPSHKAELTKYTDRSIGPQNFTIAVCSKEGGRENHSNWCSRHKLPDGRCFTFGRGAESRPYTKILSAETSPGNCCVLFSKHECLGRPQKIIGRIDSFRFANYAKKAHSVICNVPEYCDPGRREVSELGEGDAGQGVHEDRPGVQSTPGGWGAEVDEE